MGLRINILPYCVVTQDDIYDPELEIVDELK